MITVNALGDACPIPVVKTKNAIAALNGPDVVETLVDNEIAVQNLTKMAVQKGYVVSSEKISEGQYRVQMTIGADAAPAQAVPETIVCEPCQPAGRTVVVIGTDVMGSGDDKLGHNLMKAFLYALSQQEVLPQTMLFYNGGVKLTTEGSESLEDLKAMAAEGVEILSCGTCLNFYGLTDKLGVGEVTNMYTIVEKQLGASCIVKP